MDAQKLRSYVDRLVELQEERAALGEDIKVVKAEAKRDGFHMPAIAKMIVYRRNRLKKVADEDTAEHVAQYELAIGDK